MKKSQPGSGDSMKNYRDDKKTELFIQENCKRFIDIDSSRENPIYSITLQKDSQLTVNKELFVNIFINYGGSVLGKITIVGEEKEKDIVFEWGKNEII